MSINLDLLSLRELQLESARAIAIFEGTNNNLSKFNKLANHNSQNWYKVVIKEYITVYGDLPSRVGPGKSINLLYNVSI